MHSIGKQDSTTSSKYKLLLKYSKIKTWKNSKTFLEIAGFPNYENVYSNILKFYFDSNDVHNFGNLFIKSLEKILSEKTKEKYNFVGVPTITREYPTKQNGRIDIVIEVDSFVIVIENKIYHNLNNNLNDYYLTAKEINGAKKPIGVILSLKKIKHENVNFTCITYAELFEYITRDIGKHLTVSNQEYLIYLNTFMKTIHNLAGSGMNTEEYEFIKENYKEIQDIINSFNKFNKELDSEIIKVRDNLQALNYKHEFDQWMYGNRILVHDFFIGNQSMAIATTVDEAKWEITLCARVSPRNAIISTDNIDKDLVEYLSNNNIVLKKTHDGYRYTCHTFGLDTDIEDIILSLNNLLLLVKAYK